MGVLKAKLDHLLMVCIGQKFKNLLSMNEVWILYHHWHAFLQMVDLQIFKVKSFIFFNIWKYFLKGKKVKEAQLKLTIKQ